MHCSFTLRRSSTDTARPLRLSSAAGAAGRRWHSRLRPQADRASADVTTHLRPVTLASLAGLLAVCASTLCTAGDPAPKQHPAASARQQDARAVEEAVAQLEDAELTIRAREIAVKMAELNVSSVKVSLRQLDLRLEDARAHEAGRDIQHLELERKQVELQAETARLEAELAKLELQRARLVQRRLKRSLESAVSSDTDVQIEYLKDDGVIILRGSQDHVRKIQKVLEDIGD